jgi:outer membrane protein OmpA-like peptidoglycan-associated protein
LEFCQAETNEATVAVSTDERNVYVYKDDAGNGDIFYSEFQDGRFKDLQPILDNGINTESWEPHITVAIDGNSKYFSSNREGGFGGRDIYRIVKLPNGEWSEPYNLGPTINTPYDEDSPFIAGDNKTMYYSSNGPQSMGGFDVFLTILYETDDFTGWSYPINLGYPLNSTGDDIYYTTTADGKTGYISSYRLGGEGDKDIYEIRNDFMGNQNISFLNGEIIIIPDNASFPEDIQVTLECKNCDQKSIQTLIPRMRDGKFFSTLQKCSDYELTYTIGPEKTVFYTSTIKTNCEDNFEEINECVILDLNDKKGRPVLQYEIVGGVADIETKQMLENAKVEILDESGNLLESLSTNSKGTFTSKLAKGKTYGESMNLNIRVSKDKYVTQQFNAKVLFKDDRKIKLDYYIDKLEVGKDLGKILALNPIYFDLDKSDIRPDAEIELNKIVQIMNDNPEIKIELGSHTDCRATASYNLKLSDARAKSSAAYIQSKITNPNRIYGKGYGETQLVNDCECEGKINSDCSEEEHQENRRTEFKIVK